MAFHSIEDAGDAGRAPDQTQNTRDATAPGRPSFALALVIASITVAAGQRWYAQRGHDPEDVWLGFALAAAAWSWLCLVYHVAIRRLPRGLALLVAASLAVVFYSTLLAELAYTHFYNVAQDRELSLLCVGLSTGLRVLFGQLLTTRGVWLLATFVVVVHFVALWLSWRGPALPVHLLYPNPPAPPARLRYFIEAMRRSMAAPLWPDMLTP